MNKPTTETAWDWYDWAMKTAVAVRAKKDRKFETREESRLPSECRYAIKTGWRAGMQAVEVIERLGAWREETS